MCTKAINDHINSIESNLINDGRIGCFYKYVNKKLNGSNGIAPLKDCNFKLVSSDVDKATLLNNYFSSVFTKDNGVIDNARLPTKVHTTMPSVFFTPELVLKFIKQLKRKGSAGPDHLPAEFYKETGCTISFPLTLIFNIRFVRIFAGVPLGRGVKRHWRLSTTAMFWRFRWLRS